MTVANVSGPSRIVLHDLRLRAEQRADGEAWVVGRVETGEFIAVPPVAVDILRLLGERLTIDETHDRVHRDRGRDVNVVQFVDSLVALGFVASVDGRPVPGAPARRPTLAWLRPGHLRWVLTWPVATAYGGLVTLAVAVLIWMPRLIPSYRDLLWTHRTSALLVGNAAVAFLVVRGK